MHTEGDPATGAPARTASVSEDGPNSKHVDVVPIMHVLLDSNGRFTGLGRFGKAATGGADRQARERWAQVAHHSDISISGLYDDLGAAVKESLCHFVMLCAAWMHDQELFEPTWIVEGTMPAGLGHVRRLRKRKGQEKVVRPLLCDGKLTAPVFSVCHLWLNPCCFAPGTHRILPSWHQACMDVGHCTASYRDAIADQSDRMDRPGPAPE